MSAFHRRWTVLFGLLSIGLGLALIVQTVRQGGGSVGFVLGFLFLALGCGRLYLLRRG
jgi:hypothetical protein